MTFNIWIIVTLLVAHVIGDFFLQTQEMAEQKSEKKSAMIFHCLIYSALFVPIAPFIFKALGIAGSFAPTIWVLSIGWVHGMIDTITADIYKHYVQKTGYKRGFFNTLGVDQLLHILFLFLSLMAFEGAV